MFLLTSSRVRRARAGGPTGPGSPAWSLTDFHPAHAGRESAAPTREAYDNDPKHHCRTHGACALLFPQARDRSPGGRPSSESRSLTEPSTALCIQDRRAPWGLTALDSAQVFGQDLDLIRRQWRAERIAHLVDFARPFVLRERWLMQHHPCRMTNQALGIRDVRAVTRWEQGSARGQVDSDFGPAWDRSRGRLCHNGCGMRGAQPCEAGRKRDPEQDRDRPDQGNVAKFCTDDVLQKLPKLDFACS